MNQPNKRHIFPTPFVLVIGLTIFCFSWVVISEGESNQTFGEKLYSALDYWQSGFFGLLGFTVQMMMILVFGYALAIVEPVNRFLKAIASIPTNSTQAVFSTGLITMLAGLFNWGFGLIIGALLARYMSVGLAEKGLKSNTALLASAGYLGMAVWHGGLSGSAPLKVAEPTHFLVDQIGVIGMDQTVLSIYNIGVTAGLIIVFLGVLLVCDQFFTASLGKTKPKPMIPIKPGKTYQLGGVLGGVMLLVLGINYFLSSNPENSSINLNLVNFFLFGLTMLVYKSFKQFTKAVASGLKVSADIFIQFPFYAGILGLMTQSGLLVQFSNQIVDFSSSANLPVFTFFSAGLVNALIPSGGGQWAVQGPVLMEAGKALGVSYEKLILAFSYGDQLTNLLQPFWALPLLAITGVKPKEMFKYCFLLCLVGTIYLTVVLYIIH
ncbi:TIGR00366 family protein [Algoriphagus halophilus]|uniref:Short-chain fatty acids transporter n=1 Tax=Algoriphagus halophilus TaxID=226505 RepID=A0A1N6DEF4_9BACT|nr:TIGR00366 family protein [Algoriphagus halophilus]SIN69158.1 short-chain fatty acids transporter [Algoriphagus halophilus]